LKITFLGTGTSTGIPLIGSEHPVCLSKDSKDKRLRSSVKIDFDNFTYIIDCGPDFRQQMINCNCKKIDGILFTHEHADHTAGLDDIRPFCFRNGALPVFGHKRVLDNLSNRFSYIFKKDNKYPGAPTVISNHIEPNSHLNLNKFKVVPISYLHADLQVYGYRFENFAYLTDLKTIEDNEIKKLKNLDVLVLNAIRIEPHFSHLNLNEALDLIKIINPKKTYLTHISHMLGFHDEVEKKLPNNVHLSYDGLTLNIS
jgi:phosphoribosyl 1,2-cyclic phosphate phosphodiesterase